MNRNYLFICGCPRSGTTAFWRLMSAHPALAIGVERYILKCHGRFGIEESLFEKERFFTIQKHDTHFKSLDGPSEYVANYYGGLKDRYEDCKYFGDKIPILYEVYEDLFKNLPNTKILFIFRNIFDVAQSYKKRLHNENDAWKKDVKNAVEDWNLSLNNTINLIKKHQEAVLCIEYEDLFFGDFKLKNITDFLGVDENEGHQMRFRSERKLANRLDDNRENYLTSIEKNHILRHLDLEAYKFLLNHQI